MEKMKAEVELVFIPSQGMGHLVSTVEMAKQIISRDDRISVTVLVMKFPFDSTHKQSLLHEDHQRLRFVYLPQYEPEKEKSSKSTNHFIVDFMNSNKPHVRNVVSKMMAEPTRLAGFVIDMFCTAMMDVADEFGLPTYVFFTSSAASLGLVLHHHHHDVSDLKHHPDAELSVATFAKPVPVKLLPTLFLDKEGGGSAMFLNIAERLKRTRGIIVNTFAELESHALDSLTNIPPVYPVGPVLNLKTDPHNHPFEEIMRWLDDQPPSSVVFLCFGSMGSFGGNQVTEIARALEKSGHRFLWSLRRPPPQGKMEYPGDYEDPEEILPEGFTERTAEIGKVIGWAPQVAVLGHAAVGGFVSHCGWNSTLESLWSGVPVAAWPMYAEQQMNAFEMVRELGLAVEIKIDYIKEVGMEERELATAEEIESGIRQVMDGGDEIREKVKEMRGKSRAAVIEGGSSYNSLGRFIGDAVKNST
ncbi:anthocyanidin 3-O-glucosyltransferase 2-like [Actinidia eriantha]|uniref:anthocyanidin 3-O-glucosyltransferase 2-like n=1 Tax=Actinidia eriantha TaxID=165200 RepID=UPI0025850006|nr:anthocyanidin 3-O-glucosyltransferase 2-like [Actinidia eriantha]